MGTESQFAGLKVGAFYSEINLCSAFIRKCGYIEKAVSIDKNINETGAARESFRSMCCKRSCLSLST